METVLFLENMAMNAHHSAILGDLINDQPNEVSDAFITNDSDRLRNTIAYKPWSNEGAVVRADAVFANEGAVVRSAWNIVVRGD